MNAERKQALIEYARESIKQVEEARDEIPFGLSEEQEMEISLFKVALAALTAPPVIPDVNSDEYWFDGVFQHQRYERDVYKAIEAVGLKGSKKSWGVEVTK